MAVINVLPPKIVFLQMFIMRASCHGIFYTIVVWHDVLQRERMQAKGTDKEWGVKSIKKRRELSHDAITL